mmetsp:Transcript_135543/g.433604  ORF Transcript_135543/g.433604 Transcript_135543/m.433604 type:complete len:295 (+) Transcript_135543:93-977(+)
MPSTFGVLISDERMARIARHLLTAHAMIVCLGLLYGILQAISSHLISQEMDELRAKTGDRATPNVGTDATMGPVLTIFVNILLPFLVPVLLFFLVRAALKSNSMSSMQMLCLTDGVCTCCTGCTAAIMVMYFTMMEERSNYVSDITCENFGWTHPNEPKKVDTRSTLEDCEAAKETAMSVFEIYSIICLIAALLAVCMLCNCCVAAYKANQSFNALQARSVFCGPPLPPLPDMLSGQNGVVMVIGQPIGTGAMPMGQPVLGGPVMGSAVPAGPVMGTAVPKDAAEDPSQAQLQV